MYDGSLAGIIDRFSSHKIVTLQFAGDDDRADRPGPLRRGARGASRPRSSCASIAGAVAEVLAAILAGTPIEDVSVEDPPLEEVIAECSRRRRAERRGPGDRSASGTSGVSTSGRQFKALSRIDEDGAVSRVRNS